MATGGSAPLLDGASNRFARRRDLAIIHLAKRQLGLDDDTYRALLRNLTGHDSAARLDPGQRRAVVAHLHELGFRPYTGNRGSRGNPRSRYIHYLWNRLAEVGEIDHREGLARWLKVNTRRLHPRHSGWARPESLPPAVALKVIRQLKAWAAAAGVET